MPVTTFTETMRGQGFDLCHLRVRLDHPENHDQGFTGTIESGKATGPGFSGPVTGGDVTILAREDNTRVIRYRLDIADPNGPVELHGVKTLRATRRLLPNPLRVWKSTTTITLEATRNGTRISTGTARVHVSDLLPQLCSLHGAVPRFILGFLTRVIR